MFHWVDWSYINNDAKLHNVKKSAQNVEVSLK